MLASLMEKLAMCFSSLAHPSGQILLFNADTEVKSYLSLAKLGYHLAHLAEFGRVSRSAGPQYLS